MDFVGVVVGLTDVQSNFIDTYYYFYNFFLIFFPSLLIDTKDSSLKKTYVKKWVFIRIFCYHFQPCCCFRHVENMSKFIVLRDESRMRVNHCSRDDSLKKVVKENEQHVEDIIIWSQLFVFKLARHELNSSLALQIYHIAHEFNNNNKDSVKIVVFVNFVRSNVTQFTKHLTDEVSFEWCFDSFCVFGFSSYHAIGRMLWVIDTICTSIHSFLMDRINCFFFFFLHKFSVIFHFFYWIEPNRTVPNKSVPTHKFVYLFIFVKGF